MTNYTASHDRAVVFAVSPTVALDYQARGVFPDLCPPAGATRPHFVRLPRADAHRVLEDAVAQRGRSREVSAGLRRAYWAHAKKLLVQIGSIRGIDAYALMGKGLLHVMPEGGAHHGRVVADLFKRLGIPGCRAGVSA